MINWTNWEHRWHAASLIYRRELRSMLMGWGIYVVLSLALLVGILLLQNYLNYVDENGLLILSGAFNFPLFAVIFLSAIYLALSSVTTIARERDRGTMEALFYGPVDAIAYSLGKYLAQIVTYLVMLLLFGICFLIYVTFTNFTFPPSVFWVVLLSIVVTSDVIAFGIFLSASSGRARGALMLFLSIVLVFVIIQFGRELLGVIPIETRFYNPVVFLQNTLALLNRVASWLSPFSFLMQGMEAVRRSDSWGYVMILGHALLYSLLFLLLSVLVLTRKGVRR